MKTELKEFKIYDWMVFYLKLDLYDLLIFAYLYEVGKDGQYHKLNKILYITSFVGLSSKKSLMQHLKKLTIEKGLLNFRRCSEDYDDLEYSINHQTLKNIMDRSKYKILSEDNKNG